MPMRKFAKKISNSRPKGITSILVVIAVAVILTTIIGGIAALTVREIRQASNTELSNRALQTAESGVKAMAQKLNTDPTYEKTNCDPTKESDENTSTSAFSGILTDPNQQITCITSTSKFSGSYESFLDKDNATQVFLGEAYTATAASTSNTPVYLKVSWNNKNLDNPARATYLPGDPLYPASDGYNSPAAMEISLISWPSTGISGSNSEVGTIFIMPGRDDAGFSLSKGGQVKSTCNLTTDYTCSTNDTTAGKVGFNIFAALGKTVNTTTKFALRIKPRYANTHFKIEAYNTDGTAVNIQSSKAQIDVTAKVGELYRRVKAEKLVLPSSVENVFDSVLFAGNNIKGDTASAGICKNLITKNPSGSSYVEVKGNCT